MAAEREPPTLIDYAVAVISPVLIMLMVGSLVFFLVEVLYAGKYTDRLLYTMFFFVAGAVLVARIAIRFDRTRASMYGLTLGVVTFLAMNTYVDYPSNAPLRSVAWLVNLGLLGVIWWSAHKLTWDCTYIDGTRGASGRGMLAAAGLDADARTEPANREPKAGDTDTLKPKARKKKRGKHDSRLWDWIERYKKHRASVEKAPHTPGVWVIYFALAALPLFALGQSLIEPDDAARRRRTFALMAVYVGSGLGLLVITSLLGLRRYLRQRKARMPAALTAGWLGLGGVLIVVFLTLGAFLPRPHSEVPWFGITRASTEERKASKYAQSRDSAGTGEGAESNVTEKGDGKAAGKNGKPGGSGSGNAKRGGGQKRDAGNRDAKRSKEAGSRDAKRGKDEKDDREAAEAKDSGSGSDPSDSSSPPELSPVVEKVAAFLKWLVSALVVFLVIIAVIVGVLRYLAPFTDWARNLLDALRNWWASLFSRKPDRGREVAEARPAGPVRPPPFSAFSHPFEDGTAPGRDPAELIAYTFAGLDSWAWDRGHGREPTETPLEFAARLGQEFPDMTEPLTRFANLYARSAYSTASLPADALRVLEEAWDQLVHGAGVVSLG